MSVRNVVVVTDTANVTGGSAKVALGSAIALARHGIRVYVFAAAGPAMPELTAEPNLSVICLEQPEALAHPAPLAGAVQGLWNAPAAKAMGALLATLVPEETVVHAHGWTKALSSSVLHEVRSRGFALTITLHEYFSVCPNGSFYLHNDRRICKLQPMGLACIATNCDSRSYAHKLYRVARQAVQERVAKVPSGIRHFITISSFSRAILEPYLGDAHLHDIANPIEASDSGRVEVKANDRFIYLGRLSPEKGAELFARAARRAGARAVFIGGGPSEESLRAEFPEADFLGWLAPAAVTAELRRGRALVVPSLWYENAPLVVGEAAALGLPAIVADTCAARDMTVDGVTGLWFAGGDENALATALRAMGNADLAAMMGRAAYQRFWNDPPTMEKHVSSLLGVYEEIVHDQV